MAVLGDYIRVKHGFAFKGDYISSEDNGVVLVTPGNFAIGGGFKEEKCKFFYGEYQDEYVLQPGDLIVTMTDLSKQGDTLGYSAIVPKSRRVYLHNQRIGLVDAFNPNADKKYLYWFMRSTNYQKTIVATASGSTVKHTSPSRIYNVEIDLPPIDIQKKISRFLSVLDDKIELNQKINDNLQQQAFAIFDRLLSNEHLSEYSLSQIATINPKRILKKNEPARCIDMAQLSTSGGFPNGWEVKPYNGGMRFSNGDTLLARITPCLENGKTAYIDFLDENEVAFGSTEYVVITSQGEYPPEFFYCLARYPAFVDYAVKNMNGSSGRQRVSAEAIGNYVLPMLTDDELSEFRSTVPCLFRAMRNNSIENMSLAQLRDALLPKLMSGEIDVTTL